MKKLLNGTKLILTITFLLIILFPTLFACEKPEQQIWSRNYGHNNMTVYVKGASGGTLVYTDEFTYFYCGTTFHIKQMCNKTDTISSFFDVKNLNRFSKIVSMAIDKNSLFIADETSVFSICLIDKNKIKRRDFAKRIMKIALLNNHLYLIKDEQGFNMTSCISGSHGRDLFFFPNADLNEPLWQVLTDDIYFEPHIESRTNSAKISFSDGQVWAFDDISFKYGFEFFFPEQEYLIVNPSTIRRRGNNATFFNEQRVHSSSSHIWVQEKGNVWWHADSIYPVSEEWRLSMNFDQGNLYFLRSKSVLVLDKDLVVTEHSMGEGVDMVIAAFHDFAYFTKEDDPHLFKYCFNTNETQSTGIQLQSHQRDFIVNIATPQHIFRVTESNTILDIIPLR